MRFAIPESGSTSFDDAVFGRVEFANTELEDFVLLRSDGGPTYHLSVVADDIDLRITHIIRGADHISNTPKQVLLYQALGAPLPTFAHVPLILGPDKTRLSKRHGATSVMAYRDEGIVPPRGRPRRSDPRSPKTCRVVRTRCASRARDLNVPKADEPIELPRHVPEELRVS